MPPCGAANLGCRRLSSRRLDTLESVSAGRIACPTLVFEEAPLEEDCLSAEITQLASRIRLLLMDVDGVLTNGKLYNVPGPDGKMAETKGFDSQDGIALQWMARVGIATGLISGRVSPATVERAAQCKFKYVYQGHTEKIPILEEILADAKLAPEEVAYIGDDFTDVVVMRRVGLAIATANARPEMKPIAHYVTQAPGGEGAVREVVELLLKAQGKWDGILKHYEISLEK
jgi:3-deoxy-D-manno-octulosonate 8-phosphate phosphatase (KDO 8-P phosphatase)